MATTYVRFDAQTSLARRPAALCKSSSVRGARGVAAAAASPRPGRSEQFFTLKHVPGGGALGSWQQSAPAPQAGLQPVAGSDGVGGGAGGGAGPHLMPGDTAKSDCGGGPDTKPRQKMRHRWKPGWKVATLPEATGDFPSSEAQKAKCSPPLQ